MKIYKIHNQSLTILCAIITVCLKFMSQHKLEESSHQNIRHENADWEWRTNEFGNSSHLDLILPGASSRGNSPTLRPKRVQYYMELGTK